MDISSDRWLSEMELEDEFDIFHQCQAMGDFHQQTNDFMTQEMEKAMGEQNQLIKQCFSSESYSTLSNETSITSFNARPTYNTTDENIVIPLTTSSSTSSQVLSFANTGSGSPPNPSFEQCVMKPDDGTVYNDGKLNFDSNNCGFKTKQENNKRGKLVNNKVPTLAAQDHIMAERRRREKLSQRFIALSALVPGLKKMDKASVLGDAIKHLKQLQERVNTLEEQTRKRTVESVFFVNKSQLTSRANSEDSTCSSNDDHNPEALPEIEARVSDKNVLIRIHCEKNKGVVVNVLSEIEKMNLTVLNSTSLMFGTHALDITVVAQIDNEFGMTMKNLVNNLRLAFLKFM